MVILDFEDNNFWWRIHQFSHGNKNKKTQANLPENSLVFNILWNQLSCYTTLKVPFDPDTST